MYQRTGPKPYKPFETTTATFVDTPEALAAMLAELKTAKEIAVDLEHHDNRSYIGLVSLMQISTRDKDWIVDTLKPWRRQLECLNQVFANPNIIKVLHGAYMDIVWLQRDLGLYIVGLFDTYHAARSLGYPGASLAYLLDRFIKFQAQKQYQLADWRIRPLTTELFEYARADTHFLLYIFDNMRNELVDRSDMSNPDFNKVSDVMKKSKETALQRYEHPVYDSELGQGATGWYRLVSRTPVQFTPQQFAVFKAVHKWRDDVAREEDDSPIFIMPNHALFSIAKEMPKDKAALFTVIVHVSHILKQRVDELVSVVQKAKASGMNGPDLYVTLQRIENIKKAERESRYEQTPAPLAVAPAAPSAPAAVIKQSAAPLSLDISALRSRASLFWGSLVPKHDDQPLTPVSMPDITLAVPLPPLTADAFADSSAATSSAVPSLETPKFVAKEDRPAEDTRTDIFVVKQLGGRKRKAAEALASPSVSTPTTKSADPMLDDEIMLEEDDQAIRRREKAARKEAQRVEKEAKRAEKRAAREALQDEDEEAFDYANAPSVLHANAPSDDKKNKKGKKEKKKKANFNPYAKLADVPKGLPPVQKETAGRSRTFQS